MVEFCAISFTTAPPPPNLREHELSEAKRLLEPLFLHVVKLNVALHINQGPRKENIAFNWAELHHFFFSFFRFSFFISQIEIPCPASRTIILLYWQFFRYLATTLVQLPPIYFNLPTFPSCPLWFCLPYWESWGSINLKTPCKVTNHRANGEDSSME